MTLVPLMPYDRSGIRTHDPRVERRLPYRNRPRLLFRPNFCRFIFRILNAIIYLVEILLVFFPKHVFLTIKTNFTITETSNFLK